MCEIAHRFVTDFFTEYDLTQVRIAWLQENDDLEIIGEYGFDPVPHGAELSAATALVGMVFPSRLWRNDKTETSYIALQKTSSNWTADGKTYVMHLTRAGMSIGMTSLTFFAPNLDQKVVEKRLEPYIEVLGMYLTLERRVVDLEATIERMSQVVIVERSELDVRINLLTDRQLQIVRLMAHNKANAQIATELGYSISTVHSDSIDIYRILGVNSRHGAVNAIRARLDAELDEMKDQ
jgi:DNA-binding CsgD family transcriptional regulator